MPIDERTQLWLVRHGATEWSEAGRHTSVTDLPLLPAGERGARQVGELLSGHDFGLVLSSPRLRATETARLAGFPHPVIDDDLVEWSYGKGEGLTSVQIREAIPDWRIWTHGAPRLDREGDFAPGEDVDAVEQRLTRVVERARTSGVARVLAFGHGHALRSLAMVWLGLPVSQAAHFPLYTGRVSVLGYEKESPALVAWNVGDL